MSRNLKVDIAWAMLAGTLAVCCAASMSAAKYTANLEECNRNAKSVCESIACENLYRAAEKRQPRIVPVHCTVKDAGAE